MTYDQNRVDMLYVLNQNVRDVLPSSRDITRKEHKKDIIFVVLSVRKEYRLPSISENHENCCSFIDKSGPFLQQS